MCHMSTEGLSCLLKDCHARGGGRAPGAPLVPPPIWYACMLNQNAVLVSIAAIY